MKMASFVASCLCVRQDSDFNRVIPNSSAIPILMKTWGAIFDWDGVILDSSMHHEESWEMLAKEMGRTLPDRFFKKSFGMKNGTIIPRMLEWSQDPTEIIRISKRKEELYRVVVREKGIEPLPGIRHWLETLEAQGIPRVIGSSTERENIRTGLEIIGLSDLLTLWVTSEDVSHGKPDPEVFLKAAAKIEREPQRCIVFEDAHVGVEAGKRGGMKVLALSTTHPASELHAADRVVAGWSEVTFDAIDAWFPA